MADAKFASEQFKISVVLAACTLSPSAESAGTLRPPLSLVLVPGCCTPSIILLYET